MSGIYVYVLEISQDMAYKKEFYLYILYFIYYSYNLFLNTCVGILILCKVKMFIKNK